MKEGERVCKFLKIFENFWKNLNDRKKMMGLNGFLKWFEVTEIMTGGSVGEYGKMCPGKHIYITTPNLTNNHQNIISQLFSNIEE